MKAYPYRFVARATIEFTTPFIIGGGDDLYSDSSFVRDANNLPTLPGSSLAGVLRHRYAQLQGSKKTENLFGWQQGGQGEGSRLTVSWGCIHDSSDRPIEGIIRDRERLQDPVLFAARQAVIRDHVRIGHRGSSAETGKFDERIVQAGHRFTFELHLVGTEADQPVWHDLIALLNAPDLRLGGKTRRGFGSFKLVRGSQRLYRLTEQEELNDYLAIQPTLTAELPGGSSLQSEVRSISAVAAQARLVPEAFWMFGGGDGEQADMNPVRETKVYWEGGSGSVSERLILVPGSAVKGALAHRTAFHYNALTGRYADGLDDQALQALCSEGNLAVKTLFGYCKDNSDAGQRGRILVDDLYYTEQPGQTKPLNHVAIDRFTGGAFEGALFSEEPLWQGSSITLNVVVAEAEQVDDIQVRKAFCLALTDLAEGRLALGGGSGRGNGFFKCADGVQWNDEGAWITQGGAACSKN